MLRKASVLKIGLGGKNNDITLRDVQLWEDNETNEQLQFLKGQFIQYVNLQLLPIWLKDEKSGKNICYTTSSTTLAYFSSKLKYQNRGIVIEVTHNNKGLLNQYQYIILFRLGDTIHYMNIDLTKKQSLDLQIEKLLKQDKALPNTKHNSIDAIILQSKQKNNSNINKVIKNVQIGDKKLLFNETLSKLILGGLRLRGIPNSAPGFQKLYRMTFDASEFAHRFDLKLALKDETFQISFETMQETVETLLKLFTKS